MIARVALALIASTLAGSARAGDLTWKKRDVNPASVFEAAGVMDVDGDGTLDIVSGDTWYKGPDFKPAAKVRDVEVAGTYRNCFSEIPIDANGDGRPDFVTTSYFRGNVGWVENPGSPGTPWAYHEVDKPGPIEAAVAVDLTGDGVAEILPNSVNVVVFYILESKGAEPKWRKVDLGTQAAGHGVGHGDVDGDGKVDILTPKGWFQSKGDPASPSGWAWHPDWNLGATGISILARDVDGDGLSDVVYGMGHDRGLFWLKQSAGRKPDGPRAFGAPISIDPTLSSVHTLLWADLDGDGFKDELITGKRVYAHEVEAGDVEPSQVAYYTFDRPKAAWVKHPIYAGRPAHAPADPKLRDAQKDFDAGTAGTGLEMTPIDLDGDGDLDLVCPGKSGLYVFENLGRGK